jgi:hypothetical protein
MWIKTILESPLLQHNTPEDVVDSNAVSKTPSPSAVRKKKDKKGKKKFKY